MSRTDVHRPYLVQVSDWHNRHRVLGYAQPHRAWDPEGDPTTGRRWPWPLALYDTCGCWICSGQYWRRRSRRRGRHEWQRLQRELYKAGFEDIEDWHVPMPGPSWWY
jgi:hypothetical protein